MKNMTQYIGKRALMRQIDDTKINYIDSCFLTTNSLYQKAVLGDSTWFNHDRLSYVATIAIDSYTGPDMAIRRYLCNFDKLLGSNPAETTRYTNPNHVSRDNSLGMLMMAGKFGHRSLVSTFMLNTIKRFSLFQNTHKTNGEKKFMADFADPQHYGIMLRAILPKWALILIYPVLLFCDIFMLLNTVIHVVVSKKDPSHTSTVFHMISMFMQAKDTQSTLLSRLSTYIMLNFRSYVPGYDHIEPVVSAIMYYSRQTYDPPIYEIVERSVKYLRS